MSRISIILSLLAFAALVGCPPSSPLSTLPERPNIIFVMVDDLGYGDLGSFGQEVIRTPNLDQMAAEGRRFTQCYAGAPVCAPSRSTLMTGLHTGHTTVRGNKSPVPLPASLSPNPVRVPLKPEDVTVAEVLKQAGYVTGMTGKWGLGEHGSVGEPHLQGFDQWRGYLNQRRAHDHFVEYFWQNQDTFFLEGNSSVFGEDEVTYSHHLFTDFALNFIQSQKDTSFFLYVPYCLPHGSYQIPRADTLKFADKAWTADEKVYAAMVERIDTDMGRMFSLLEELQLDENTLVFFCSDNGAARRWEGRFNSSGPLRGRKRDMYEGGIRTPMIAWMPGIVPAGTESDYPWYFPDVLPSLAALVGTQAPTGLDGMNVLPEILGEGLPPNERKMYWEFHEGGFFQAVRWKQWKAVREGLNGELELYDLSQDLAEAHNIAAEHPGIVQEIEAYLQTARTPSPYWNPGVTAADTN